MPLFTQPIHEHGEPGDPDYPHPMGKAGRTGASGAARTKSERAGRPIPLKVDTVKEAIPLILQGKVVELRRTRQVNTLLRRLAAIAHDAQARGEQAPNYDLCNVSVAGTNLFCADKVRTKEFPNGVPRIRMPQFVGEAVPGSTADRSPKDKKGRVDGASAFVAHLKSLGIRTSKERVPSAYLKASQSELIGPKVAAMMERPYDARAARIFISRDGYVVDGHHRWASVVGLDASDGKFGDMRMRVVRIDAPITEVLHIANRWTKAFGIRPVAGVTPQYPKATGARS